MNHSIDFLQHATPIRSALALLFEAHECAAALELPARRFGVEIGALCQFGLTDNHLRLLARAGYIERIDDSADGNSFFVLTAAGLILARQQTPAPPTASPLWLLDCWELRLGRLTVKKFRRPAHSQMAILNAFQQLDWPRRIASPFTALHDNNHERLHDAIKRLNDQDQKLIIFHGDGTGQGVTWELLK